MGRGASIAFSPVRGVTPYVPHQINTQLGSGVGHVRVAGRQVHVPRRHDEEHGTSSSPLLLSSLELSDTQSL